MERGGKKTAAAVHQEITRELDTLLPRIFAERRRAGDLDLEAVELALRTALHAAGAAGLSELLREPRPIPTTAPGACGSQSRYKDMRLKPILTVLGPAQMLRAYYWCSHCRRGRFPADRARDIEDTGLSPGVRRMMALVGSECSSFDHGRQQMELLADLEVTAKAVERVTFTSPPHIIHNHHIPSLTHPKSIAYALLAYVPNERRDGRAHTREAKLGFVFTQTTR